MSPNASFRSATLAGLLLLGWAGASLPASAQDYAVGFQPRTLGAGSWEVLGRTDSLTSERARKVWVRSEKPIITGAEVSCIHARDLAILKDLEGRTVKEGGLYVAYYWARDAIGYMRTYRAVSFDLVNWSDHQLTLSVGMKGVDEIYAGVGTVIKAGPEDYRMWYQARPAKTPMGIGYAVSTDGINWVKRGHVALGTSLVNAVNLAVPHVATLPSGEFVMFVEGSGATDVFAKWRVYGFRSPDGVAWTPMSQGLPLLDVGPPGAWDNGHVANPKFLILPDGRFLIQYNGAEVPHSVSAGFQIGFAVASQIEGPYVKESGGPVIGRNRSPLNYGVETSAWQVDVDGQLTLHFIQDFPGNSRTSSIYRCSPLLEPGILLTTDRGSASFLTAPAGQGQVIASSTTWAGAARDDITHPLALLGLYDASYAGGNGHQQQEGRRLEIRRATASYPNPGDVTISYLDRRYVEWYWNGQGWSTIPTWFPAELERPLEAQIEETDEGWSMTVKLADTGELVAAALVSQGEVRPFRTSRMFLIGDNCTTSAGGQLLVTRAWIATR